MTVRAKFVVNEIAEYEGTKGQKTIKLRAVYGDNSPENKAFWNATPSGKVELNVINQTAAAQFEIGKEYYLDFTLVESSDGK